MIIPEQDIDVPRHFVIYPHVYLNCEQGWSKNPTTQNLPDFSNLLLPSHMARAFREAALALKVPV